MASVERRGSQYTVRWRDDRGQHRVAYATKSEAMEGARAIEAGLSAQRALRPGEVMPLSMALTRWVAQRSALYRDETAARVRRVLAQRPQWRSTLDIGRDDMLALPVGDMRLVRSLLRYAASIGGQVQPGAVSVRRRVQRRPDPPLLTDDQVAHAQRLADAQCAGSGLAVHLLATYGHRPISVAGLCLGDLCSDTCTLTLRIKGGDIVRHPVLPETIERWRAAAAGRTDPSEPAALAHDGRPWGGAGIYRGRLTSWYMQQIGRYAHPHDAGVYALKRYAISRMLGLGLDPRTIASITGHRTVSLILDRYARTHDDRQRAALAALAAAGVPRCAQIEMATQSKGPASA